MLTGCQTGAVGKRLLLAFLNFYHVLSDLDVHKQSCTQQHWHSLTSKSKLIQQLHPLIDSFLSQFTSNLVVYIFRSCWNMPHPFLQSVPLTLCIIVYFSGPIQLSLDVFLAQLSMSLHTSFVCNLMWYATRLRSMVVQFEDSQHFSCNNFFLCLSFFTCSYKLLSAMITHSSALLGHATF